MNDKIYMQRALDLALLGSGAVSTNPLVGAVIVYNDRIIGEGYHKRCGGAHAEVEALNSVSDLDKPFLDRSVMYVSLEPCSHWGKTPPCCDRIIENRIKRVVVAMEDPFHKVCGNGIEKMRSFGITVQVGLLKEKAEELNRRFLLFHSQKRPYIILKWARSVDGYIDSDRDADTPAVWITGESCKTLVHKWRNEEDAIWVGKNTVLRDNPELTNRKWYGKNPLRVSMDNSGKISSDHLICNDKAETVIFNSKTIPEIIDALYENSVQSVIVEGGKMLLEYLISHNLYDEIREFVSPIVFNVEKKEDYKGVKAPEMPFITRCYTTNIGDIEFNVYRNDNKICVKNL